MAVKRSFRHMIDVVMVTYYIPIPVKQSRFRHILTSQSILCSHVVVVCFYKSNTRCIKVKQKVTSRGNTETIKY